MDDDPLSQLRHEFVALRAEISRLREELVRHRQSPSAARFDMPQPLRSGRKAWYRRPFILAGIGYALGVGIAIYLLIHYKR